MSTTTTHPSHPTTRAQPASSSLPIAVRIGSVPWYIWTGTLAVTSASIGAAWDVSWHRSIGRDSFWTPAHMAIYACGILAGIVGVWLVVNATWGRDTLQNLELRANSIRVFSLRAPLGVFLAGWGGLAMLTSAPFDNWWHNAYGLDVKIISPPHALLVLGIRAVGLGMVFLILASMNRSSAAAEPSYKTLQILFLYLGGLMVDGTMFFLQEATFQVSAHRALAYIAVGMGLPVYFAVFSQASRFRWAATLTAAIYMAFVISEILILPLFAAQPKLGPVFYPVTHFVPPAFPVLLVVPALALDLLWQRTTSWKPWHTALLSGVLFIAVLVAVQWPFADFLVSPHSQNRFFGTGYYDYSASPTSLVRLHRFSHPEHGLVLWLGLLRASAFAAVSSWIGLRLGRWMRGVQR